MVQTREVIEEPDHSPVCLLSRNVSCNHGPCLGCFFVPAFPFNLTIGCATDPQDPGVTGGVAVAIAKDVACSPVFTDFTDVSTNVGCDNAYVIERQWTCSDGCGGSGQLGLMQFIVDVCPSRVSSFLNGQRNGKRLIWK